MIMVLIMMMMMTAFDVLCAESTFPIVCGGKEKPITTLLPHNSHEKRGRLAMFYFYSQVKVLWLLVTKQRLFTPILLSFLLNHFPRVGIVSSPEQQPQSGNKTWISVKKKLRFVSFRGFLATILEITFRRNVF